MRYSSKLAVASHILMCIDYFQGKAKLTSDFLAGSVNVNPVVIRNTLGNHENPNPACPVGRSVHPVLEEHLGAVQKAMEAQLDGISLQDLVSGIR